jgi:cupin fold WbuC family metalloprotein
MRLSEVAVETGKQIFHGKSWNLRIDEELISDLIAEARENQSRKERLCLHPKPEEIMQVTYLALIPPYEEKVHCHPHRPEVLIPILGEAESRTFDDHGKLSKSQTMRGDSRNVFFTNEGKWHSLKVLSPEYIVTEIGEGPFHADSTVFFGEKGG